MPFPGSAHVAAGRRNPPTLRDGELGVLQEGYRGKSRKASTGAGGWRWLVVLTSQSWLRKGLVLRKENEGSGLGDDSGSGRVPDRIPGRFPEVLRRAFGSSGVVCKWSKLREVAFSPGENRIRLPLNLPGKKAFRESTREGVATLEDTFQN